MCQQGVIDLLCNPDSECSQQLQIYPMPDQLTAAVIDVSKLSLGLLYEHCCKVCSSCPMTSAQMYIQTCLLDH